MDFLHHPLFRSVLLPLSIAFASTGLLRLLFGARLSSHGWASTGLALALVVAAFSVVGWRAGSAAGLTGKLPWVIAAAALSGLVLDAVAATLRTQWLAASVLWAIALFALGTTGPIAAGVEWLLGAAVIAAVTHERSDSADAPALLAVAGLGLAGVAMISASLLLFELAVGGAVAAAGVALWLWPRARMALGASGRIPAVVAWLAVAHATARLTTAPLAALALLALVFAAGPLVGRWRGGAQETRHWTGPLWRAALGGIVAAGALALTLAGSASGPTGDAQDSPYYAPRW